MAKQGRKTLTAAQKSKSIKDKQKYLNSYRKKFTMASTIRFNIKTEDPDLLAVWSLIENKTAFVKWCVENYGKEWLSEKQHMEDMHVIISEESEGFQGDKEDFLSEEYYKWEHGKRWYEEVDE